MESNLGEKHTREIIQQKVQEAYHIASNLYKQFKTTKSDNEIKQLIISVLRSLHLRDGKGHFFFIDKQGIGELTENGNIRYKNSNRVEKLIKNIRDLITSRQEGYLNYLWSEAESTRTAKKKISYFKNFHQLHMIIGAGLYPDEIRNDMHLRFTKFLNHYRFGKKQNEYILVLELLNINGGDRFARMLTNPNRPDLAGKYLSDNYKDAKGNEFRKEFLAGLRKNGQCFVNYHYMKPDHSVPSAKTSYFRLTSDKKFIVTAGLYQDDIEESLILLQKNLRSDFLQQILTTITFVILLVFLTTYLSYKLNNMLTRDYKGILKSFHKAVRNEQEIDQKQIYFREFNGLAQNINAVLRAATASRNEVLDEKERLNVTLRSIADGVITTDTQGRITLINEATEKMTGWTQNEAAGLPLTDLFVIVHTDSGKPAKNPITEVLSTGMTVSLAENTALIAKDKTKHLIEDSAAPIFDKDNTIIGCVLVFRDVTREKQVEKELQNTEKLQSVGVLAGGIAHDFNNILGAVLGNLELARMTTNKEHKSQTFINNAIKANLRARKLTQQLLTFAKGGNPIKEIASIKEVIMDSAGFVMHGSSIKVHYSIPNNLYNVKIDSGQIGQVIQNIVLNAREALFNKGCITIECCNIIADDPKQSIPGSEKQIKITISDNGAGISEKHLKTIFDPYFTTKETGSGLGLSVCHSIIRKHAGRITVTSIIGQGTTFTICLPALTNLSAADKSNKQSDTTIQPSTIIIMDDEKMVRDVTSHILTQFGHTVLHAEDGQSALDLYSQYAKNGTPVDCVIMDLTIPGRMGGEEAARKLLQQHPNAKLIVSSGYSNDPVMTDYSAYGFQACLKKPFLLHELSSTLHTLLS